MEAEPPYRHSRAEPWNERKTGVTSEISEHWRHSSARDYMGLDGIVPVERVERPTVYSELVPWLRQGMHTARLRLEMRTAVIPNI